MPDRLNITDFDAATVRHIVGLREEDEPVLAAVHALLRPGFAEMANQWLTKLDNMPEVNRLVAQRLVGEAPLERMLIEWLERLTAGPYDSAFVQDIEDVGISLADMHLSVVDLLAARTDMLRWARGRLTRSFGGAWERVDHLYTTLERLVDFVTMLMVQGMTQAVIDYASGVAAISGSGTYMEDEMGIGSHGHGSNADGSLAMSEIPTKARTDSERLVSRLRERLPEVRMVLSDYAGSVKQNIDHPDPDEAAGMAQLIARKGIQISKNLGLKTFNGATLTTEDGQDAVMATMSDGLAWVVVSSPTGHERVAEAVAEVRGVAS